MTRRICIIIRLGVIFSFFRTSYHDVKSFSVKQKMSYRIIYDQLYLLWKIVTQNITLLSSSILCGVNLSLWAERARGKICLTTVGIEPMTFGMLAGSLSTELRAQVDSSA